MRIGKYRIFLTKYRGHYEVQLVDFENKTGIAFFLFKVERFAI